jgi:thermitase
MKSIRGLLPLMAMIVAIGSTTSAVAAEYLVKYRSDVAIQMLSHNNKFQITDVHSRGHLMKVDIPENRKLSAIVELLSNPNVEYMVPNARMHLYTAPVDTQALQSQWAMGKVNAEQAWQRAGNRGSKGIVVAVIDTGADYNHKSLAPNMVPGYDFAKNDSDPMDQTSAQNPGHGTHCSGIIGATGLVDQGTIGLSPEVSIMPLRFIDETGGGDLNNSVKAIDYAIDNGAKVISASWGAKISRTEAQPIIEAIERANKAGIVFVVAAANDGKNNDKTEYYPTNADLENTISVAASNSTDAKPSWSNFGRAKVNIASPGDGILSTLPSDKYGNLSGTSMATPLVAGLVALIRAQDPTLNPMQIRSLLQASAAKVAIETACDCRIDASSAVDMVVGQKMFVSPFAATIAKGSTAQFEAVYGSAPFNFTSSNPNVGTIDGNGLFTAVSDGDTTITVADSRGQSASSYKIYVGAGSSNGGGGGGGGGGGAPAPAPGNCPLGDPLLCQGACMIFPELPWCTK